jgi:lysophospholipase L1-like esterase
MRIRRLLALLAGNLALFTLLFLLLELGYRVRRDGLREAFARMARGHAPPYSNLGTGNWVVYDPELGYRLNPAGDGINEMSIRHPPIALPKPVGLFRLLVLGDSIPWDRPGFVEQLGEDLKDRGPLETINASVPGYTSYQELLLLKRSLLQAEPDLVVWTYCLNDNHRFLHRFDQNARMLMTQEAQQSLEIHSWWDRVTSRSYVLTSLRIGLLSRRHAASANASAFPWEAQPDFNIAWKDYSWRFYEGQLREMVELLSRRKTRLVVMVVPYEPQLLARNRRDRRDYVLRPQTTLSELCRKYGVPYLDLYSRFEQAYDRGDTLYRDGVHLSQEGHRLTSAELLRFLDERALLPVAAK